MTFQHPPAAAILHHLELTYNTVKYCSDLFFIFCVLMSVISPNSPFVRVKCSNRPSFSVFRCALAPPTWRAAQRHRSLVPRETDSDSAPTSYKSNLSAVMFQKQLSFPKLNTIWEPAVESCVYFCTVRGWPSAWAKWIISFSYFLASSGPLLSHATVRVRVYARKRVLCLFPWISTAWGLKVKCQINSFCFVLTFFFFFFCWKYDTKWSCAELL